MPTESGIKIKYSYKYLYETYKLLCKPKKRKWLEFLHIYCGLLSFSLAMAKISSRHFPIVHLIDGRYGFKVKTFKTISKTEVGKYSKLVKNLPFEDFIFDNSTRMDVRQP